MYERFTERARQVVVLAQEEARQGGYGYIGCGHLWTGILREDEGNGARALKQLGWTAEGVREIHQYLNPVELAGSPSDQIPFTPNAKKALELSLREALSLGHNYVGTEHIVLGLVRGNATITEAIVAGYKVSVEDIRNEVIRILSKDSKGHYKVGMPSKVEVEAWPVPERPCDSETRYTADQVRDIIHVALKLSEAGHRNPERILQAAIALAV